jgi:hypothetical protein
MSRFFRFCFRRGPDIITQEISRAFVVDVFCAVVFPAGFESPTRHVDIRHSIQFSSHGPSSWAVEALHHCDRKKSRFGQARSEPLFAVARPSITVRFCLRRSAA